MAELAPSTPVQEKKPGAPRNNKPRGPSKFQQLNKLYALPAPLRTFPLPTFVPHNPLSIFHLLYVWISHTIKPQSSHFDGLYKGVFSSDTRSVHVTDARSIRGMWEQGFYGKGTLSRSEPSWINREKTRQGEKTKASSEDHTKKRRAERQKTKWERARKEREAIDQKLQEEAALAARHGTEMVNEELTAPAVVEKISTNQEASRAEIQAAAAVTANLDMTDVQITASEPSQNEAGLKLEPVTASYRAPVGPPELLALPNSQLDSINTLYGKNVCTVAATKLLSPSFVAPIGPLELLTLPNSAASYFNLATESQDCINVEDDSSTPAATCSWYTSTPSTISADESTSTEGKHLSFVAHVPSDTEIVGGSETNEDTVDESTHSEATTETNETPPNGSALANGRPTIMKMERRKSVRFSPTVEQNTFMQSDPPNSERAETASELVEVQSLEICDQEHLQLTLEEAFFLAYALGALLIFDPNTNTTVPNQDIFYMFRKASYFPPQPNPALSPDDPFMINYVTYHHFRSLGWVVRSGVKFSADYMLYNRGPVFSHAEFAVLILPSYSDPYWTSTPALESYSRDKQKRTWAWMSCINRVITQVKKTLILTYVDIPKPLSVQEELDLGIHGVLAQYKVREFVMNRFAANRMRD